MIIKPSKSSMVFEVVVLIMELLTMIYFIFTNDIMGVKLWGGVFLLFDMYLIRGMLVGWRTLYLDEKGCTMQLYKYKKSIPWDEVLTKRIEKLNGGQTEIAFFSTNVVKKSKWRDPCLYTDKHPSTCFFVKLTPSWRGYKEFPKVEFMRKMNEWGIELEVD